MCLPIFCLVTFLPLPLFHVFFCCFGRNPCSVAVAGQNADSAFRDIIPSHSLSCHCTSSLCSSGLNRWIRFLLNRRLQNTYVPSKSSVIFLFAAASLTCSSCSKVSLAVSGESSAFLVCCVDCMFQVWSRYCLSLCKSALRWVDINMSAKTSL